MEPNIWKVSVVVGWFRFDKKRTDNSGSPDAAQLGALIDKQVTWTDVFIRNHPFAQTREGLRDRLAYIQHRRSNKFLYLAVVGEFNSGKSTFINALISDNLLRVGVVPVTANPTRIMHGRRVDIEATFQGVGRLTLHKDRARMFSAINALRPHITPTGDEMGDVLQAMTADPSVAHAITDCVIRHSDAFLRDGIVIIDTPGLNDNQQVEQATIKVIRDEADLCLIVIPSEYQHALTLIRFLSEHLGPMLHRCIFLVTKMDFKEPDPAERAREQERILGRVTRMLEDLGLRRPLVFPVAAQPVIRRLKREKLTEEDRAWVDRFDQLRRDLARRLKQDRQIAVIERLIGLMAGILTDLDKEMAAQQQTLTQQAEALERAGMADFDVFIAQERMTGNAAIDESVAQAQRTLGSETRRLQSEAETAIKNAIYGADDSNGVETVIESGIDSLLNGYHQAFNRALAGCAGQVESAFDDAGGRFTLRFNDRFNRLTALAGQAPSQSTARLGYTAAVSAHTASPSISAREQFRRDRNSVNMATGGIVAAGMAIGTAAFPGIGTLLGGVIAAIISFFVRPSLDQVKERAWESVSPHIGPLFDQKLKDGQAQFEPLRQRWRAAFSGMIDQYVAKYRGEYTKAVEYQARERQRLEASMAAITRERADASQRRAMLEEQLKVAREINS